MICLRCKQEGCPNPQEIYMSAGQGDQCLRHLRALLMESKATLEKVGSLKMDTEIAELQHKLTSVERDAARYSVALRSAVRIGAKGYEGSLGELRGDLRYVCENAKAALRESK